MIRIGPNGAKVCSHGWSDVKPVELRLMFKFRPGAGGGRQQMPELWGVDDERETARIRAETLHRDSRSGRNLMAIGIIGGIGGLTGSILRDFLNPQSRLLGACITFMTIAILVGLWQRRRLRLLLPKSLATEGRCTKCGFDLKENKSGVCPECGKRTKDEAVKSN